MDTNQASAQEQANDLFYYSKMSQLGIEEWVSIPGYEQAYEVSNMGKVRSLDRKVNTGLRGSHSRVIRGMIRSIPLDAIGRPYVTLCVRGQRNCFTVNKLVASAFLGVRPHGLEVCHSNGQPADNRLFNLRYDTHANNMKYQEKHGTKQETERHYNAKLTNEEASQVIKLLKDGQLTHAEIVKRVPSATIAIVRDISRGKSWKSLAA